MHSAERVAGDTCLYAERYIFKVVNNTASLPANRKAQAAAALNYYFGGAGNSTAEDVAVQVCFPDQPQSGGSQPQSGGWQPTGHCQPH